MSAGDLGHVYGDGEAIIHQGESGNYMYVVLEGQVEVVLAQGTDTRRLALLGEGEFFGEMELFSPGARNATVRALGPTRILTIDKQSVMHRIQEDPQLAFHFLESLARRMRVQSRE